MSLVNDMLRDLDARRREAPSGTGPERLIPASSNNVHGAGLSPFSKVLISLAVGGTIAAVILLAVLLLRETPVGDVPVASQSTPQPSAPSIVAQVPSQNAVSSLELERMAQRMIQLEQQNQLLQQQASAEIAANATPNMSTAMPAQSQSDPVWEAPVQSVAQAPDQVASIASQPPVLQADTVLQSQQTAVEPTVTSLTRSPSELSFRDKDRLQVQQSLELWQSGRRNASLDALRAFVSANAEAHQSREMLIKLLLQQGDTIGALAATDTGLEFAPDYAGYKKLKARILMAAGVPNEAALLLQSRAPSLASDNEYHELLAASQLAGKEYEAALYSYRALVTHNLEEARWWYGQAAALDALGRGYEAAQSYERSLRLEGLTPSMREKSQERLTAIRQN